MIFRAVSGTEQDITVDQTLVYLDPVPDSDYPVREWYHNISELDCATEIRML